MTYPKVTEIKRNKLEPGQICAYCGHKARGYKAPKAPKTRKISMRDLQGSRGPFVAFAGINNVRYWQEVRYLAATNRAEVPAHDPAFGKLAA